MSMSDRLQFQFNGNGGEYFRIWIVNVCLSIITLGVYSAWAKVRRTQYFYRHTTLAGSSFDYHGDPKIILKGRVFAVLVFAGYSALNNFNPIAGGLMFISILLIMPWLLVRSLRFRLHNTSYRGLRLAFHGNTGEAYLNWLLYPILTVFTAGLAWPLVQNINYRYIRNHSSYGNSSFKFEAKTGDFVRIWVMASVIALAFIVGMVAIVSSINAFGVFAGDVKSTNARLFFILFPIGMAVFLFVQNYYFVRLQNLIWMNTQLAEHRFSANYKTREMYAITLSNLLLIVLTLGLYKPFADIRLARYRIESLNLLPAGDFDGFLKGEHIAAAAAGEEVADIFDFDISL